MIDFTEKSQYDFDDLVKLVKLLRSPGGCPWDMTQTHQSIRRNFIEETYEACEAMDEGDPAHLREELGDVLLQVVFHAGIEADAGTFGINDVCDTVCRKLIQRHPHLFSEGQSPMDWEELKRMQRGRQTVTQAMEGVSHALPALWQADKLLEKAERSGLYHPDRASPLREVARAAADLKEDDSAGAEKLGRALFALAELSRCLGVDPESALTQSCKRFIRDFSEWEAAAAGSEDSTAK